LTPKQLATDEKCNESFGMCASNEREREREIEKECLKDNEEREKERTEVKNCKEELNRGKIVLS
jgi:hypothetical protein